MQRRNNIQNVLEPAPPPLPTHRSIHNPTHVTDTTSPQRVRCKTLSFSPLSHHAPHPDIHLSLHQHTISAIHTILHATTARDSGPVHLSHPSMPVTLNHLKSLHQSTNPANTHHLSHRAIYHYFRLNTRSPLIPRFRYLSLTIDNIIFVLTPNSPDASQTRQYYLHLFLNPYKRSLYLQYTYEYGYLNNRPASRQHLTLTTSLPNSLLTSTQPKRHLMLRTTTHVPGQGEMIIFSAASIQHQMSMITLVIQMILSIPVLHTPPLS